MYLVRSAPKKQNSIKGKQLFHKLNVKCSIDNNFHLSFMQQNYHKVPSQDCYQNMNSHEATSEGMRADDEIIHQQNRF